MTLFMEKEAMFKDKNTESKYSQNRFGYISKSQKKRLYFIKRIYNI